MTQTLTGKAVDGALRIARYPADRIVGLTPEGRVSTSAGLIVDRTDARVRALVASLLRDPELRNDAHRRDEAADQRETALRVRAEAEKRSEEAASRTEERREDANDAKAKAARDVKKQRDRATDKRDKRKARASKTAQERKASARAKAGEKKEKAESEAKADKLDQLDTKAKAVQAKKVAASASDESRRVRDEAQKAKAARKSG